MDSVITAGNISFIYHKNNYPSIYHSEDNCWLRVFEAKNKGDDPVAMSSTCGFLSIVILCYLNHLYKGPNIIISTTTTRLLFLKGIDYQPSKQSK